jgi:hypothetical protein
MFAHDSASGSILCEFYLTLVCSNAPHVTDCCSPHRRVFAKGAQRLASLVLSMIISPKFTEAKLQLLAAWHFVLIWPRRDNTGTGPVIIALCLVPQPNPVATPSEFVEGQRSRISSNALNGASPGKRSLASNGSNIENAAAECTWFRCHRGTCVAPFRTVLGSTPFSDMGSRLAGTG